MRMPNSLRSTTRTQAGALFLVITLVISGCATAPAEPVPPTLTQCELPYAMPDPWEPFNRAVYNFNARFDEAIFLPVSRGYQRVLPQPVRTGVNNFFANLGELGNLLNHSLQGRAGLALHNLGRFLINTTVGIGGLFDPANSLGLDRKPTGFGDTLARWGSGSGPYLVVPFVGPSSLRDGTGMLVDSVATYQIDLAGLYQSDNNWALGGVNAVDTRANINFRYYDSGSPFEYEMVRFLYTNKRMIESEQPLPNLDQCERPQDPG